MHNYFLYFVISTSNFYVNFNFYILYKLQDITNCMPEFHFMCSKQLIYDIITIHKMCAC